jgi:hypothetical protein
MSRVLEPVLILLGAGFTVAVAVAAGKLLLRRLQVKLYRAEEHAVAFVAGSAALSAIVFALCALRIVYVPVLIGAGLLILGAGIRAGVHRPLPDDGPPLGRFWKWLFVVPFAFYFVLYFFNAMAPEMSADGSGYHLGMVIRYLREHGFYRITWHIYANLSHGLEMLYMVAFAIGRHSAAAMVHCAFLVTLPFLMVSYGRRFGFPGAGVSAALFAFASPIAGVDGISAYNDVCLAAVVFALFLLLQIWDAERSPGLLPVIGLLAGFCYAVKYTGGVAVLYALGFIVWKLVRAREPWLRPALIVGLSAAVLFAPWMIKNWIILQNPFSPLMNKLFPNPYIYVSFEQEYSASMRSYELKSLWELPAQLVTQGKLAGLYGPLFALAPVGLLSLRRREGRQLLLAAAVFASTYFGNIGARFLMWTMPFVALAMALAFSRIRGLAPALAIAHVIVSWPTMIPLYCHPWAWRLERIPIKQALRIESQHSYLNFKSPSYRVSRLIEEKTEPGSRIFTYSGCAEAYCSREVLVGYYSAFNNLLGDIITTPLTADRPPVWQQRFRFPARELRKVRVVQTASGVGDWSVSEMRVYQAGSELPRSPEWRLSGYSNRWSDVQLGFDNSPVTRWKSWRAIFPGMYLEVDFGKPQAVDSVLLECSRDQFEVRVKLEGQDGAGKWIELASKPEEGEAPPLPDLRRAAMQELKARGVGYLLYMDKDWGAKELRRDSVEWGITLVGTVDDSRLYRID